MALGMVAVLPEHGVDVVCAPVHLTVGHIVPAVVGAEVASELELPLILQDGKPDGARRCPLGEVALHRQ
jgi:hypothetical protein